MREGGGEVRTRVVTFAVTIVLVLVGLLRVAVGEQDLKEISCLDLNVNVQATGTELGLAEGPLLDELFVAAKSKLPRVRVGDGPCFEIVWLKVMAQKNQTKGGSTTGYFGAVTLAVYRPVRLMQTNRSTLAIVWTQTFTLSGPLSGARQQVLEVAGELFTSFVAAYYRAGNP
jgi:hypothetical protein